MLSSGMWRRVSFVRTDVSEKCVPSTFRAERFSELGRTLQVTSKQLVFLCSVLQLLISANTFRSSLILSTLKLEVTYFPETSVLTRAKRRHISEDGISHNRCTINLKSYLLSVFIVKWSV
jgi:hypothetical protein